MLLAVAAVWGSSYGVAKEALAFYPVLGFMAVRFCLTALLVLPALRGVNPREALASGLPLGGVLLAIFVCETYGVAQTRAANAAFLISLCVVLTPFAEWLLLGNRPARGVFAMAAVAAAGAWLLAAEVDLGFNRGDGLMLAAALLRAVAVCVTKRHFNRGGVSPLALTAVLCAVVGVGCLAAAWVVEPAGLPPLPAEPVFWRNTLYLVAFCSIFAFFAQNYGVKHGTPTRVALLTGAEPVFGALFAALWLGERIAPSAWLGGGLIVASVLWLSLPARQPARA